MTKLLVALAVVALSLPAVGNAEVLSRCRALMTDATLDESTNSAFFAIPGGSKGVTAFSKSSNVSGTTPTLNAKIQLCKTATAADCADVFTFDECETGSCYTTGIQYIDLSSGLANALPFARVVTTLAGTDPVYNVSIGLCY